MSGLREPARGVVIVGGGLAAQRCAETLRKRGYEAPVRIVCAEAEPPYDRPPLSKDVAAGDGRRRRASASATPTGTPTTASSCCSDDGRAGSMPAAGELELDDGAALD